MTLTDLAQISHNSQGLHWCWWYKIVKVRGLSPRTGSHVSCFGADYRTSTNITGLSNLMAKLTLDYTETSG